MIQWKVWSNAKKWTFGGSSYSRTEISIISHILQRIYQIVGLFLHISVLLQKSISESVANLPLDDQWKANLSLDTFLHCPSNGWTISGVSIENLKNVDFNQRNFFSENSFLLILVILFDFIQKISQFCLLLVISKYYFSSLFYWPFFSIC